MIDKETVDGRLSVKLMNFISKTRRNNLKHLHDDRSHCTDNISVLRVELILKTGNTSAASVR